MYQLLLSHLPVARTIVAGVDLTTIAADGANQCDEENSAMEVLGLFSWLCFSNGSNVTLGL